MRIETIGAVATAAALLAFGGNAPDSAAETVTRAPAAETVTAPTQDELRVSIVVMRFDRVQVGTVAAPVAPAAELAPVVTAPRVTPPAPRATPVTPAAPAAPPVTVKTDAHNWAESTLEGSGVTLPANVEFLFSDSGNCGADISAAGQGGCTYTLPGKKVIVLSPGLAWTEAGSHVLFHEAAHALGVQDECAAEAFAHQFEEPGRLVWSYPACK